MSVPRGGVLPRSSAISAVVLALALVGCSGSGSSSSSGRVLPKIPFVSPAIEENQNIPARYTCSGNNVSLSFRWGSVPPNTAELVLAGFSLSHLQPSSGGSIGATISVDWVVTGLTPTLHKIAAGRLPPGAVVGRRRYSICPEKGTRQDYLFRLYALPNRARVRPGFDGNTLLSQIARSTLAVGWFTAHYERP
jgi:phosphatidylethanolamine-binding protein (PEBP) family uncharacterized protein